MLSQCEISNTPIHFNKGYCSHPFTQKVLKIHFQKNTTPAKLPFFSRNIPYYK